MTAATEAPPLVRLAGARLGYPDRVVLEGVDLEVRRGDFLAIVGPNGAGKTTILRAVLGVVPPLAGACAREGRLGYAPQRSALDPVFPLAAADVVGLGLVGQPGPTRGAPARARVLRALEACGMAAHAGTPFRDLSGGQKQRVLVARALVSEPDVLVLDEPTNDLDLRGEHEVMELVRALHAGGRTVIMVSHLLHVVARYAQRIAFIHDGLLVAGPARSMLSARRLEPLYGMPVVVGDLAGHPVVAPKGGPPGRGGQAAARGEGARPAEDDAAASGRRGRAGSLGASGAGARSAGGGAGRGDGFGAAAGRLAVTATFAGLFVLAAVGERRERGAHEATRAALAAARASEADLRARLERGDAALAAAAAEEERLHARLGQVVGGARATQEGLLAQVAELSSQTRAADAAWREAEAERRRLREAVYAQRETLVAVRQDADRLRETWREAETARQALEGELARAAAAAGPLAARAEAAEAEARRRAEQLAHWRDRFEDLRGRFGALESRARSELEALLAEVARGRAALDEAAAAAAAERARAEGERARLEGEAKRLAAEAARLAAEVERLRAEKKSSAEERGGKSSAEERAGGASGAEGKGKGKGKGKGRGRDRRGLHDREVGQSSAEWGP